MTEAKRTGEDRPTTPNKDNHNAMATDNDVLLLLYTVERDEQWERDLLKRLPGRQLQVRWQDVCNPDGSIKAGHEHDPKIFEGVTILFTYAPVPTELVPKLRFVQLTSAGSDAWQGHPKFLDSNVKFATTSGSNA